MKVIILYVEFGADHRAQLDQHLITLIDSIFPDANVDLVIIDNAGICKPHERARVLPGDNSEREFSAWELALKSIEMKSETVVCLCNDTFARNYGTEYLRWFQRGEVRAALDAKKAVGYTDSSSRAFTLFGLSVRKWLRTNLVFVNADQLASLRPLTLPAVDLFAHQGPSLFKESTALDQRVRRYIEHWLIGAPPLDGESPDTWYKSAPLNQENRAFFQSKALSILGELWFSARLKNAGISLFDIRRSRVRALGAFYVLDKLGLLEPLQNLRRKLR